LFLCYRHIDGALREARDGKGKIKNEKLKIDVRLEVKGQHRLRGFSPAVSGVEKGIMLVRANSGDPNKE